MNKEKGEGDIVVFNLGAERVETLIERYLSNSKKFPSDDHGMVSVKAIIDGNSIRFLEIKQITNEESSDLVRVYYSKPAGRTFSFRCGKGRVEKLKSLFEKNNLYAWAERVEEIRGFDS